MARIVVVGGDAAGMSAATTIREQLGDEHAVIAVERTEHTSYAACGIPYWIAGEVGSEDDLVARSPDEHRKRGIDLRTVVEALAVDPAGVLSTTAGDIAFDHLLIATGAEPVRPDWPGVDAAGVETVTTLDQGRQVIETIAAGTRHATIIGAGYIGIELAEACLARGLHTTLVHNGGEPLELVVPELGALVREAMTRAGITFLGRREVTGVRTKEGRVSGVELRAVDSDDPPEVIDTDLVILGVGVRPRSELAVSAGLELGPEGSVVVDERQHAGGRIWAAGDCSAVRDRITGELRWVPLGDTANRQGLVAGHAIVADVLGRTSSWTFPGIVQTAITKFQGLEIARTGLSPEQAAKAGFAAVTASIDTTTKAGYYPGAEPMTVWLTADRSTACVLGAQLVGGSGAGLRIDVAATAITAGMGLDDLIMLDLAYAPPFGSVWHPLQVAARRVRSSLI